MTALGAARIANLAFKILAVALAFYPLLDPASSHFSGKAMGARAIAYPLALMIIPILWASKGRPQPYPHRADAVYTIPFVVDAGGNVLGLFALGGYDLFAHFLNWMCLVVVFGAAIGPTQVSRRVTIALAIGFGATSHVLWEIAEFLLMQSGSSGLQLTYENTMLDFMASFLGTLVGAAIVAFTFGVRPVGSRGPFGWPDPSRD